MGAFTELAARRATAASSPPHQAPGTVEGDGKLPLQYLYEWERVSPNRVFLTQPVGAGEVRHLTWRQVGDEVRRMAAWLASQGWPSGSRIGILGKNSAHWVLADLAIAMAGHVSVPIFSSVDQDSLHYILEHAEARACFVGKLDDASVLSGGVPASTVLVGLPLAPPIDAVSWNSIIETTEPRRDDHVPSPDALWTIVYTSGTTGRPKGVMLEFRSLKWAADSCRRRVEMTREDRLLSYLPLAHIMERITMLLGGLRHGCHTYFIESPSTFMVDLQRAQPTLFMSVPRLWIRFLQGIFAKQDPERLRRLLRIPLVGLLIRRKILRALGLGHCRLAGSGAAPLPVDVLDWYRELGLELREAYGMTENCGISHATNPGDYHPGTVGTPAVGVECRIDPTSGEIQLRSSAVMVGYYKDPELTAAAFTEDGWLRTGDRGRLDESGCLRITGRLKEIFKTSKGKYVAPAPIEALLMNHPAVESCLVAGASLDQPLALVTLSAAASARAVGGSRTEVATSLCAHLASVNARLASHERLDCIVVLPTPWTPENGMTTPTLKVRRARVEAAYSARFSEWVHHRALVTWA